MSRYHVDLDAIKQLRAALALFASQQTDGFQAIENEIARAVQELHDAERHWRAEIERRHQALRDCYIANFVTAVDCSSEERAATEAEEKLSALGEWQARVSETIVEYRAASERFAGVLDNEVALAGAFLDDRIKALEAYRATVVSADRQNLSPQTGDKP